MVGLLRDGLMSGLEAGEADVAIQIFHLFKFDAHSNLNLDTLRKRIKFAPIFAIWVANSETRNGKEWQLFQNCKSLWAMFCVFSTFQYYRTNSYFL